LWKGTYRGSSTPHHTPVPATDPSCPFPEQAPSVYTTSSAIADILDGPAVACDLELDGSVAVDCDRDWPGAASSTVDEDEDAGTRPLRCDPIEVLDLPSEWFARLIFCFMGYGTAGCIQASASSSVLSFLYLAQG
jgi:hypothetical protein